MMYDELPPVRDVLPNIEDYYMTDREWLYRSIAGRGLNISQEEFDEAFRAGNEQDAVGFLMEYARYLSIQNRPDYRYYGSSMRIWQYLNYDIPPLDGFRIPTTRTPLTRWQPPPKERPEIAPLGRNRVILIIIISVILLWFAI